MHNDAWATISDDGVYRYILGRGRRGGRARRLGVVMVNPSTADASKDDPTITKLKGFCDRLGYEQLLVANLFAFRTFDVRELAGQVDPVGPDADDYLQTVILSADTLVFAWGPLAKLPKRLRNRWRLASDTATVMTRHPMCWGTAQDGHPRHPLMVAYATPLVPWYEPDVAHLI